MAVCNTQNYETAERNEETREWNIFGRSPVLSARHAETPVPISVREALFRSFMHALT